MTKTRSVRLFELLSTETLVNFELFSKYPNSYNTREVNAWTGCTVAVAYPQRPVDDIVYYTDDRLNRIVDNRLLRNNRNYRPTLTTVLIKPLDIGIKHD